MSRPIPAAFISGLLFAALTWLAFPPFESFWWLSFLAPVPLIAFAEGWARLPRGDRPRRRGFGLALVVSLGVLPLWLYEMQWVIPISAFGYFPMAAILALFLGAFAWVLATLRRRWPR